MAPGKCRVPSPIPNYLKGGFALSLSRPLPPLAYFQLSGGIQTYGLSWNRGSSILETIYGKAYKPHLRETLHDVYRRIITTNVNTPEIQRESKGYATQHEQWTHEVLRQIHVEIDYLKRYRSQREYNESERIKVEILRQRIPDSQVMERLLRYETHLSRESDRILNRLERLERMRKGQPLPPQVDVNIFPDIVGAQSPATLLYQLYKY